MSSDPTLLSLEDHGGGSRKSDCSVCGFSAESIKQLKTHLLLKHPELHFCLFCVEKKGWSDTFATSSSYNEHYWNVHQGIIQKNEKKRNEEKDKKKGVVQKWKKDREAARSQGLPPPKRPTPKLICTICQKNPEFESGAEFDRHYLVQHGFDYCKICHLMGPISLVRHHILTVHPDQLCYICCGTSPQLEGSGLNSHLANKHGLKTRHAADNADEFRVIDYPCFDCDAKTSLTSHDQLVEHLVRRHRSAGESLRAMMLRRKRRRSDDNVTSADAKKSDESLLPPLTRICGIKNESGQDCFCIAGLHLLAQTDIFQRSTVHDHHSNCPAPSCLLAHFLETYCASKKRVVSTRPLVDHYDKMGLTNLPVDCGDFLRAFLRSVCADPAEHAADKEDLTPIFRLGLEWKYECPACNRFSVMNLQDFVLKIDGSVEGSLEDLLNRFLHQKKCRCGNVCQK